LLGVDWLEVSVQVDGEAAEAVSEVLNRYGRGGVVIEHLLTDGLGAHDGTDQLRVKAYLAADDAALKRKVEEALWHLGRLYPIPEPVFRRLAEADWAEAWKQHYAVLHVGRRTVIVPRWLEYTPQAGEVVITLDPGMAFGTGTHPTTRLCLQALERYVDLRAPDAGPEAGSTSVLDMGTGSGVLSISAAKQGLAPVLALDIDELAVAAARENVAENGASEQVEVGLGSLDAARGPYDLVLVNILAEVICALFDGGLAGRVRSGGTVIASGIIDEREPDVQNAFEQSGLTVVDRLVERDWVALVGRKAG
jgi:ribosomal protein L11 methyltransferase